MSKIRSRHERRLHIEFRTVEEKKRVKRAARLESKSMNEFIREAALDRVSSLLAPKPIASAERSA